MQYHRNQDIGVVGSPSSNTELTVDLLLEATEERIVGALVALDATQNGAPIKSVGQIVGVELRNRWHEDSVFRNLIKRTGDIPPITNRQDTRIANLMVGATFKEGTQGYEPDVLGMVPSTGTRIARVEQPLLNDLLKVYRAELFYLGRAYANDVFYPMWFKHFGSGPGGAGEAYHIGVFGKTGSGKSGLAKMLLLAYARHKDMGILVIDPQGEFSYELQGQRVGKQGLAVDTVVAGLGREVMRYDISDLQLSEWELLEELLLSQNFFRDALGIRVASNAQLAAELVTASLRQDRITTDSLASQERLLQALAAVRRNANRIYTGQARAAQLQDRVDDIVNQELADIFDRYWQPVAALFQGRPGKRTLFGIIDDLVAKSPEGAGSPLVVIDISQRGNPRFWNEELQSRILARLLDSIVARASQTLADDTGANVLVVLDEAHRHAPSGSLGAGTQAEALRNTLRGAVRETRKYGVGWLLINQTLGGIDNEILQQLRIQFFGFGLALGDEFRKLREFAGGDNRAMELYQSFRDPQSAPRDDLREFSFMAVGPVSPLSFSGRPLFFSAFIDPQEFSAGNNLPSKPRLAM